MLILKAQSCNCKPAITSRSVPALTVSEAAHTEQARHCSPVRSEGECCRASVQPCHLPFTSLIHPNLKQEVKSPHPADQWRISAGVHTHTL